MAITLQLATALQKSNSPAAASTTAAPAGAAASDDAQAAAPFATLIDDLLKPLDAARTAVVAEAAPETELPADAATSADAATQALLASLLVPVPQASAATPTGSAEVAGELDPLAASLQPTLSQPTTTDELPAAGLPLLPHGKDANAQHATEGRTAPTAGQLPLVAADGEQSLPQVAANLAAPDVASRLRALMPERGEGEEARTQPLAADVAQVRAATAPAAPAATAPAATLSAAQYTIPEPVAGSRWAEALGQRAMFMVDQQVKSAELHLNPPHLGPLEVKLALDGDKATLSFSTNQAAVREAVQQSLPRLHQVFADNGMAGLNVQVHLGQQQQPQQQQERQAAQSGQGASALGSAIPVSDLQMQAQASRWHMQSYAAARGGVDTFA